MKASDGLLVGDDVGKVLSKIAKVPNGFVSIL